MVSAFAAFIRPPGAVCADKTSHTLEVVEAGRVFAVNVLAAGQQPLSNRFASKKDEHRRFEGVPWRRGATGAPLLEGTVAALDCRVVAAHDAGDHVIYVGQVEAAEVHGGEPLLYHAGGYRELAASGQGPR
jgi:flavin reductase (DIM6/NTAB) family NADH-FMN oxidoreductase RutF